MDELLIVLQKIQEQLEGYSKEIENAKESNRKQDKEIETLKAQKVLVLKTLILLQIHYQNMELYF